ncbi:Oxidoreductase-like, N-terminal [Ostreococcus tauri]|jgi:hypothetical protein|uniref:Oxidoreductase-like, N-terminal n=1 Tax=Ostreococcus tauri TaxID=70448 RepID=A0A096PAD5_OSTTA|nr:Oxidoreductase-like, N-terminal [Ostreococcus tauri]OUS41838.1 hypothetical protein BE221DRAFT_63133 [Ostreococcus tauri]CEG01272.1 Oxidoreductase-like, N-terminal [Ostreococcus tauri]|eukprot:XP_003075333.2 Oxidoreductase-like, N-terminal [Ostreococcus tauri]
MLARTARSLAERVERNRALVCTVSGSANRAFAASTKETSEESNLKFPKTEKPNTKPKRDLANPVVAESIRRKKLAKGIVDDRLPPPPLCAECGRRFCRCARGAPEKPREPLDTDCCHSEPRCKFCVFVVYRELLEEYENAQRGSS